MMIPVEETYFTCFVNFTSSRINIVDIHLKAKASTKCKTGYDITIYRFRDESNLKKKYDFSQAVKAESVYPKGYLYT